MVRTRKSTDARVSPPKSWSELLSEYERFATRYRDLSPKTVKQQRTYINRFFSRSLARSPAKLFAGLSPRSIQEFLFQYAKEYSPGSRRWMQFSLRAFLRFCRHQEYIPTDLAAAVPTVHKRRLATVPKAIDDAPALQLLNGIDTTTPSGMRDHAIGQILFTYGVRGIQVRTLTLDDIDWRKSCVHFRSTKGGKAITQHLTPEVGNSLLRYLRHGRPPETSYREVFLTRTSSPRPLRSASVLSNIIARRLGKAQVTLPDGVSHGSHSFRHRFAKTMLDNQVPLKSIADMLGHRHLDSTFVYSKVDLHSLRQAAHPWPEEVTP